MKKVIYTLLVLSLFAACSTRKTGVTNRTYHRITSWYNTIFNGDVALENDLKAKKQSYIDNFSTILKVEPINPFTETGEGSMISSSSNQPSGFKSGGFNPIGQMMGNQQNTGSQAQGLDRTIEKGQKAIENHSMLIKGKEYNSMLAEAYLMLARAHYYKKEPFEALNYLNYMNSTLVKNRKENQAKVYIALAKAQAGNSFEANEMYDALLKTKLKKRDIKFAIKAYSQFLIDENRYEDGIEALDVAKKYNKTKYERGRYSFIQGQLSEKINKEQEAVDYYQMAFNKKPSPELEIKSQIALSRLFEGDSVAYHNRINFLKKLTKQGLYQSRKNELYYAMGISSLKMKKEQDAMKFLQQSLKEKESDPQVRALAFQSMGDIYFSKPDYIYAGAYYDSAVSRFTDPAMKTRIAAKSNSLKEVIKKYYLVKKNDSILTVAHMTPEQRSDYFQKYIDKLKVEEERAKKELEKKMQEVNTTVFATETAKDGSSDFTSISTPTSGGKWYFYNTSLKQTGQSEFRKLWGDRSLVDNWRISKQISSLDDLKNQLLGQEAAKNPRRFEVSYYTEKIPQPSELENLKKQRDTAELSLGIMYYDKLHDAKSATSTLEHLISTPPHDPDLTLAAMYNIYRFNKEKNPDISKKYADLVTTNYPNTRYAENILNPEVDVFKSKSSDAVQFYEEAYKKYENGKYTEVKEMSAQALEKYPTDEIIAKFSLLSAFCDAKLGDKTAFMDGLERVAAAFESKDEGKKAAELLIFFKNQEKEKNAPQPQQPKTPEQFTQPEPMPANQQDFNLQNPPVNDKKSVDSKPKVRSKVGSMD